MKRKRRRRREREELGLGRGGGMNGKRRNSSYKKKGMREGGREREGKGV